MGGALNGGVNFISRDFASALEALPCVEKCVCQTRIEKARFCGGSGEIAEDLFDVDEVLLGEASAGVGGQRLLEKRMRSGIDSVTFDGAALEDDDPHLKVGSLLDKDMFLRGEEPEKIAATNLVATVTEKIGARASGDEIQFELGVVMTPVGSSGAGITPGHAVEFGRKVETL